MDLKTVEHKKKLKAAADSRSESILDTIRLYFKNSNIKRHTANNSNVITRSK